MDVRVAGALAMVLAVTACMPHLPRQAGAVAKPASPAAAARSFYFDGVLDRGLRDESIKVANGLACMVQSAPNLPAMQRFVPEDPTLGHIFRQEFAQAGYRGVAVDGDAASTAADYHVEAVLTRVAMNVCYPFTGNFGDGNGQASLTVEWRVFVRGQSAPAFKTVQQGYAELGSTTLAPNRILWRNAFAGAVRGLLSDDGFVAFLAAPPLVGARR